MTPKHKEPLATPVVHDTRTRPRLLNKTMRDLLASHGVDYIRVDCVQSSYNDLPDLRSAAAVPLTRDLVIQGSKAGLIDFSSHSTAEKESLETSPETACDIDLRAGDGFRDAVNRSQLPHDAVREEDKFKKELDRLREKLLASFTL
jgi:hypothetical protein